MGAAPCDRKNQTRAFASGIGAFGVELPLFIDAGRAEVPNDR